MKRIISIILCLVMVLSLFTNSFAAKKKTINYVSLGSSQSLGLGTSRLYPDQFYLWENSESQIADWEKYGYGAAAWDPAESWYLGNMLGVNTYGFGMILDGAFSTLIANEIEKQGYTLNFSQLACCGMRPQDLCWFLYDDYVPDSFAYDYFAAEVCLIEEITGLPGEEGISYFRDSYRKAIKDADFITYDLGSNCFGMPLLQNLLNPDNYMAFENIFDEFSIEIFDKTRNDIKNKLVKILNVDVNTISEFEQYIDVITYSYLAFCNGFDKSMEWIYSNNPDATVVVLQIQNFFSDFICTLNGIDIAVGEISNLLVTMANTYISSISKYCIKYYYSKLTDNQRVRFNIDDVRLYSGPEDLTQHLTDMLDVSDIYIRLKSRLTPIYEAAGGKLHDELYDKTLNSSYDAMYQIIMYIVENLKMSLSNIDSSKASERMIELVENMLSDISKDILIGKDNTDAINKTKSYIDNSSDEIKSLLAYYMSTQVAGIELLHPSFEGAKEMADAVISTMKSHVNSPLNRIVNLVDNKKKFKNSITNIVKTSVKSTLKNIISLKAIFNYQ